MSTHDRSSRPAMCGRAAWHHSQDPSSCFASCIAIFFLCIIDFKAIPYILTETSLQTHNSRRRTQEDSNIRRGVGFESFLVGFGISKHLFHRPGLYKTYVWVNGCAVASAIFIMLITHTRLAQCSCSGHCAHWRLVGNEAWGAERFQRKPRLRRVYTLKPPESCSSQPCNLDRC